MDPERIDPDKVSATSSGVNVNAGGTPSIGGAVHEIGTSVRHILQSESDLMKAEIRDAGKRLGRHAVQTAIFGGLLAVSVLPFLAFVIIGLGRVLDGRYWLSSLIVAAFCAVVGGALAARSYKKVKSVDLSMPRTRGSLDHSKEVVSHKVGEVVSDVVTDVRDTTKRRVA